MMSEKIPVGKNETYIVDIIDMGSEGQGICKIDGFTVFVPGALESERCKILIVNVRKNFAFGKLIEIIQSSPFRVKPVCPIIKRCGGCSIQHISYGAQLEFKTKRVKDAVERIGKIKDVKILPAIGMKDPYNYRNKAQFPVGIDKNGVAIGFYAQRSHDIINCDSCKIQHPVCDKVILVVRDFIKEFGISTYNEKTNKGLIRHLLIRTGFSTGEVMVCFVVNGAQIPNADILIERLAKIEGMTSIVINTNRIRTNVILGDKTKTLYGKDYITDFIGNVKFEISPLSFFQVNPMQTEVLYNKVIEFADLKGDENVLDIYCGIGSISLFLAKKAKEVLGVEIIPEAVNDARKNAVINEITNAKFEIGSAEDIVLIAAKEGFAADVVVVDPPRKGCDIEVINSLLKIKPEKIVYVSCEPSTFARDAQILCENGYKVEIIQPVDQFCHTTHVECVVLMSRKDG